MTDDELLAFCRDRLTNADDVARTVYKEAVACYQRLVELLDPKPQPKVCPPEDERAVRAWVSLIDFTNDGHCLEDAAIPKAEEYLQALKDRKAEVEARERAKEPHFLFVWRHRFMIACATGRTEQEAAAKFSEDCDMDDFGKAQKYPVASAEACIYRNHE